jgi:hypothetical protein
MLFSTKKGLIVSPDEAGSHAPYNRVAAAPKSACENCAAATRLDDFSPL